MQISARAAHWCCPTCSIHKAAQTGWPSVRARIRTFTSWIGPTWANLIPPTTPPFTRSSLARFRAGYGRCRPTLMAPYITALWASPSRPSHFNRPFLSHRPRRLPRSSAIPARRRAFRRMARTTRLSGQPKTPLRPFSMRSRRPIWRRNSTTAIRRWGAATNSGRGTSSSRRRSPVRGSMSGRPMGLGYSGCWTRRH